MITPHQLDIYSANMSQIYQTMEAEIIELLIDRINKGHDNILDWQAQMLCELHLFNKDAAKIIADRSGIAEEQIYKMFEATGHKIIDGIDSEIPYDTIPIPSDLDNIMRAYAESCWLEIENYVNQTLLSTNFGYSTSTTLMYQDIINKTTAKFMTGMFTFEEALERTIQEWTQKGIMSTFIDKGGHTWSMERYVRQVLSSTLANSYDTLRKDRMAEYGINTVWVTQHMGARLACSKIQGHVVDLRRTVPTDSKYRSIYDPYWHADYLTPGGHRGCNCKHLHIPFIPGVNEEHPIHISPSENKLVRQLTNRQRDLERRVVRFKKNKAIADKLGNEEDAKKWNAKIRLTQAKLRELVASNEYLTRNYANERVYTPISTLIREFIQEGF